MCGRFNVLTSAQGFVDLLEIMVNIDRKLDESPRYNVAPTQQVLAARRHSNASDAEMVRLRWGLIPQWAKDMTIGSRMINARSETVAIKPAFKKSFQHRRCLIAANGWYEWRKIDDRKQPYFIHRKDAAPFFFAGLWARWQGPDNQGQATALESCTILTTEASSTLEKIHPRMPLVLDRGLYEQWIDSSIVEIETLNQIMERCARDVFDAYPISTYVNKPTHDSPACLEAIGDPL
jgi:putative SOS response-associated peptidase YedK